MSETDKVFAGSIPENYDRYLVPLIFESFAQDMAQRAAALSPGAVLETAAGSGVVTRALTPRLPPDACYVVTDLNQPMLDYAATRQAADSRSRWRQADAQALPFDDGAFDLVCCQFGVMFFPDRRAGYLEAKRVLKPGGLMAVVDGCGRPSIGQLYRDIRPLGGSRASALVFWIGTRDTLRIEEIEAVVRDSGLGYIETERTGPTILIRGEKPGRQ